MTTRIDEVRNKIEAIEKGTNNSGDVRYNFAIVDLYNRSVVASTTELY